MMKRFGDMMEMKRMRARPTTRVRPASDGRSVETDPTDARRASARVRVRRRLSSRDGRARAARDVAAGSFQKYDDASGGWISVRFVGICV